MSKPISIFNEILGPVMRGPSSSHTAAAYRIGQIARQCLKNGLKKVSVSCSTQGSLPTTYHSQGSQTGLLAGLTGIPIEAEEIKDILDIYKEKGLEEELIVNDEPCSHPNTYELAITDSKGINTYIKAISTGGGMIKVTRINDCDVNIEGDTYVNIEGIGTLSPILPIHYNNKANLPFVDASGFETYFPKTNKEMWEYALEYEAERGGISKDDVWEIAKEILHTMRKSLQTGLAGTDYNDRILGQQFHLIDEGVAKNKLIPSTLTNRIIKYALAIMECKSSFGVIVAAPTAGSCAVVPSAILACADEYGIDEDTCIKSLLAAGLIGLFIAKDSTISAEVGGCQAECGAGSGMAAAAIAQMMGGNSHECLSAASFALQNILGMVCDPIAKRVEAPCLGKNIMCSMNAISSANIALAGVDILIPLSEVICAMNQTGKAICPELRCTGLGGLSVCKTSLRIEKSLDSTKLI
ncbi:MAG: L-serine ammonia-lyase, iron-sulfur-dependent, subunit alpha [Parabacteroides sp.]|nr:L-serine ammonia-lyase, iron-sulfur-dependent, subunit alpha [Parabacteroides sp.]